MCHCLQEPTQDDFDRETSYVLAEDLNQTLNQVSQAFISAVSALASADSDNVFGLKKALSVTCFVLIELSLRWSRT